MVKKRFIFIVIIWGLTVFNLSAKEGQEYSKQNTTTTFEEIQLQPEEITPQVIELEPNKIQFEEINPKQEVIEEEPDQEHFEVYVPQLQEISPQDFAKKREKAIQFEEFKPTPQPVVKKAEKPSTGKYGQLEQTTTPVTPQEVEKFTPPTPTPEEVQPKVVVTQAPPPPPPEKPAAPIIPLAPPPAPESPVIPREATPVQPPHIKIAMNAEYKKQLSELAKQLAVLKERVLEAKTRIVAYGERLTKGFTSGTKVTIDVLNNLGDDFRIVKLQVFLDGHQVFLNEYSLNENPVGEIKIYRGSILPGKHKVDIKMIVRGDKGLFDFSYSAKLEIEAGEFFTAQEGKIEHIKIKLMDKGGWFTPIKERPQVKFLINEEESY